MVKLKKRVVVIVVTAALLFTFMFAGCKDSSIYVDPAGNTMIAVTDENENTVLDKDGNIIVYQTEDDGEILTDESGVPQTLSSMFPERIIDGKYVQTLTYTLTLPSGWSVDEDAYSYGVYIKKSNNATIMLDIIKDYTFDEYYERILDGFEVYNKTEDIEFTGEEDDFEYIAANTTAKRFQYTIKVEEDEEPIRGVVLIFEKNGNLYNFSGNVTESEYEKVDFFEFFSSINFKNYKYY